GQPSVQAGDGGRYADQAERLALIANEGADAYYRGAIGEAIEQEMARGGGLITQRDLDAYEVRVELQVTGRYRGLDLAFSPGATGGVTALETLNILAEFPSAKVGWTSVEGLHLRACAIKRAFRDRFEHLG